MKRVTCNMALLHRGPFSGLSVAAMRLLHLSYQSCGGLVGATSSVLSSTMHCQARFATESMHHGMRYFSAGERYVVFLPP